MADDEFRLVSERDEKEIAAERAYSDLVWRTKQLAANILRVIAGAGSSDELLDQSRMMVSAAESLTDIIGNTLVAGMVIERVLRSLDWRAINTDYSRPTDEDLARLESDGSANVERTQSAVLQAACRLVAAQLAAQPEQESVSLNKFITAVESYTDAWEKHRTKLAKGIVTQRPR